MSFNTTFKPRKKSMRDAYADKLRKTGAVPFKPRIDRKSRPKPQTASQPMHKRGGMANQPRKALKKQSNARAKEMRLYYQEKRVWLALPQNAKCAVCLCLGVEAQPATETHHSRGRIGRLLRYQPFWVPSCRDHRETPHSRPAWAREVGLLCEPSLWNVFPR